MPDRGAAADCYPRSIERTPLPIRPQAVTAWLLVVAVVLTVLSLIADAVVLTVGVDSLAGQRIVQLVDLDAEANAPAFFSTMLLAAAGCLLALIARHRQVAQSRWHRHWWLLAVLFFGLSFDEAASLHETMIGPFRRLFPGNRFVYFGWVVPGAVFVGATGLMFVRFLRGLDRVERNRFVVAGTVFVSGALGIEVVEGFIASGRGEENWPYVVALTTQEVMEMVGAILFIRALLGYLRRLPSGLDLVWDGGRGVESPTSATAPSPGGRG